MNWFGPFFPVLVMFPFIHSIFKIFFWKFFTWVILGIFLPVFAGPAGALQLSRRFHVAFGTTPPSFPSRPSRF